MRDETASGSPSFAVVVPMFNERPGAQRCVREISRVLATLPNRTALIVVDDGSTDGTGAVLATLSHEHHALDVVTHASNRGYGAAPVTGPPRAPERQFEYPLFMASDLPNNPDDVPQFAGRMAHG